ncbi:uncharacterized protein [Anas acuta]|uniref:uncharacterized protein n=1 Tax=Anas acuta TaxID=28680 RepID=UPI0035C8B31B
MFMGSLTRKKLFLEPQGFPQEEGSSSSSVDREAADEGYRALPQTPGGQESKPSACPSPSEHSTAVLVESQRRARHASSVSEEELDEAAEIVVAAVLLHSVAIMQGATSKDPTAPLAAWARVPPPIPEPVDCTAVDETGAVATPLATVPGHQVAAEQGGQAQSSCTKDTPADKPATCQKQEPSQGLLDGPVQSSEQEQGLGKRRGAGWSWATPPLGCWCGGKAGACPSPAQALTYTSLSPTGIHDLTQAPARQPRPAHVRRALRALRRALCCSFITEEWE